MIKNLENWNNRNQINEASVKKLKTHTKFQEWFEKELGESALDIFLHGIAGGFSSVTTYHDTSNVYDRFEEDIWKINTEFADDMIGQTILEYLPTLPYGQGIEGVDTFKNAMVWLACEICAQQNVDFYEKENDILPDHLKK